MFKQDIITVNPNMSLYRFTSQFVPQTDMHFKNTVEYITISTGQIISPFTKTTRRLFTVPEHEPSRNDWMLLLFMYLLNFQMK